MLTTLLRSPTTATQAGYFSLFVWHFGGAGAFTVTGTSPAIYASRSYVIGSGVY